MKPRGFERPLGQTTGEPSNIDQTQHEGKDGEMGTASSANSLKKVKELVERGDFRIPKSCERHLIYHFDEDPADIVRDVVANIGEDDLAGAFRTDCGRLKAVDAYVGRFHGGDVWCVMAAVEDGAAVLILNAIGCEDLEA